MKHDIAIITVSYNKLFDSCLQSVRRLLDAVPLRLRYVLVDNGSTTLDAHTMTKRIIPEAQVILRHQNHGMGRSCNLAVQDVEAEYYFFLNPDTDIPDPNMMETLHAFLQAHPETGIVAPRLLYPNGALQTTCRRFPKWYSPIIERTPFFPLSTRERHRRWFHMEDYTHTRRRMVDWVQGSAFMIRADLFHEIGGFDHRYRLYYEDVDLCRECWERGRPVYYLPDVTMVHAYGKASGNEKGILASLFKNPATRYHITSWIRYVWKWRKRHKNYAP